MDSKQKLYAQATNDGKPFGAKPYHYKPADKALFCEVIEHSLGDAQIRFDPDLLYRYMPDFHVQPLPTDMQVRGADSYGFYVMGCTQSLLRANMDNVRSCTRISTDDGTCYPAGYLNYLANPAWCQIAFYTEGAKNIKFSYSDCLPDGFQVPGIQPYGTVNCLLGWDNKGNPSVWLGNSYGCIEPASRRLCEYFSHVLGLSVYADSHHGFPTRHPDLVTSCILGIPSPRLIHPMDCERHNVLRRSGDVCEGKVTTLDNRTWLLECMGTGYPIFAGRSGANSPVKKLTLTEESDYYGFDRAKSPNEASTYMSFVTDLWKIGSVCRDQLLHIEGPYTEDSEEYYCHACGDATEDSDEMTFVSGHDYCDTCRNNLFVLDGHGDYQYCDDVVYCECMNEYFLSEECTEYIDDQNPVTGEIRSTDYVRPSHMTSHDIVELHEPYEGFEYAHDSNCTEITVQCSSTYQDRETIWVLDCVLSDQFTLIDGSVYDLKRLYNSTEAVYYRVEDHEAFEIWAEPYLLTPRLYDTNILHRDAEAYAMTTFEPTLVHYNEIMDIHTNKTYPIGACSTWRFHLPNNPADYYWVRKWDNWYNSYYQATYTHTRFMAWANQYGHEVKVA